MQRIKHLLVACCAFLMMQTGWAMQAGSPVGYWKTIDDVTGQPKSIVQIWQTNSGLDGKVVKLFPIALKVCTACEGANRNKPILGMVVVWGLKQSQDNPNFWTGGEALDPKNGKTYHCNLTVKEKGQKLELRGYIGIPLFGRTQSWDRVAGP